MKEDAAEGSGAGASCRREHSVPAATASLQEGAQRPCRREHSVPAGGSTASLQEGARRPCRREHSVPAVGSTASCRREHSVPAATASLQEGTQRPAGGNTASCRREHSVPAGGSGAGTVLQEGAQRPCSQQERSCSLRVRLKDAASLRHSKDAITLQSRPCRCIQRSNAPGEGNAAGGNAALLLQGADLLQRPCGASARRYVLQEKEMMHLPLRLC